MSLARVTAAALLGAPRITPKLVLARALGCPRFSSLSPQARAYSVPSKTSRYSLATSSPPIPFSTGNRSVRLYSSLPDSYPRSPAAWSTWVPKLLINWEDPAGGESPSVGSGFFVNIPEAKYDIIFTAGHNLVNADKKLVHSVDVIVDREKIFTARTHGTHYHLSESYRNNPGDENSVNDYGCILIEKANTEGRHGFGFSLVLAQQDLKAMGLNAFVGGYPGELNMDGKVDFRYTMGNFGSLDDSRVAYHASTEKGQSGGPVWVLYKGYEVAVGIHNHDERVEGTGNRATRLNMRIMADMFRWAGVGLHADKSIRVVDYDASPEGLYLKINQDNKLAEARLGKDQESNSTTFDIIPAHTVPSDAKPKPRYAIVNKPVVDEEKTWLWLRFQPDAKGDQKPVMATVGSPSEEGMVRLNTVYSKRAFLANNQQYRIEALPLSEKPPGSNVPANVLRISAPTDTAEVQIIDLNTADEIDFTKMKFE